MTAEKPPKPPVQRPDGDDRRTRQAEALRANLRRRKAAVRDAAPDKPALPDARTR